MREGLTRDRLTALMHAIAESAPNRRTFRVYFIGGATAVHHGWRDSTIDVDMSADDDQVFGDVEELKEKLRLNIEFARPEDFVPALSGAENRHLFIDTIGGVSFFHYDPYSQLFSKLVRGFRLDLEDARNFLSGCLIDVEGFRSLLRAIPDSAYAKHPNLSRPAIEDAVEEFLSRSGHRP